MKINRNSYVLFVVFNVLSLFSMEETADGKTISQLRAEQDNSLCSVSVEKGHEVLDCGEVSKRKDTLI